MNYKSLSNTFFHGLFLFVVFTLFITGCTAIRQNLITKKYPPAQLQQDIAILQKVLEANHPGLYWYTPKDSMDLLFSATAQSITDSLTEYDFKNKIARLISNIRCGHTAVSSSDAYVKAMEKKRLPHFPLLLKVWGDSMVVLRSANANDSVFTRGTIITSINGINNRSLLDSMYAFISTDGYSNNFKDQLISFNFPAYYKMAFGLSNDYNINYIDSNGVAKSAVLHNYNPATDTTDLKSLLLFSGLPRPTKKQIRHLRLLSKRSLEFDSTNNMAYMQLNTFSGGGLRIFFRHSFKQLQKSNTKNLVIDLRQNGGGSIGVSNTLIKYLARQPFKIADSVLALHKSLPYSRYIHPSFIYWFSMQLLAHKKADGFYHLRYYEKHFFKPKSRHHYNGHIYFIQGGYTFSAASMLLSTLKGQANITLVGEETGGSNYGNNAVHLPYIELPNTGVQVVLPLYRTVFKKAGIKNGRGVLPDVLVEPTSTDIKNRIDPKMVTIKALIQQKK